MQPMKLPHGIYFTVNIFVYYMTAVVVMLNSLSLNHDKLFIWPTPRQTVSHIPDKQFVTESHGCAAFLLAHIVTWY